MAAFFPTAAPPLLDDRDQVLVENLVLHLLDREVPAARPEVLGLPPAVFAVTPGAQPQEELFPARRVRGPTLRGGRRRRDQRRAHEADEKRTLAKRRCSRFAKRNRGSPSSERRQYILVAPS